MADKLDTTITNPHRVPRRTLLSAAALGGTVGVLGITESARAQEPLSFDQARRLHALLYQGDSEAASWDERTLNEKLNQLRGLYNIQEGYELLERIIRLLYDNELNNSGALRESVNNAIEEVRRHDRDALEEESIEVTIALRLTGAIDSVQGSEDSPEDSSEYLERERPWFVEIVQGAIAGAIIGSRFGLQGALIGALVGAVTS